MALDIALLSVNDNVKGRFLVYPNPSHEVLTFSFPNDFIEAQVSFYNALGQTVLVKSIQKTNQSITLESLQSGMYFYKIESQSFVQSGKFIKD